MLQRGEAAGVFRAGLDAVELYVSIAGLGYFYLSNSLSLSAVLGRPLREPVHLEAHWRSSEAMVLRFVCTDGWLARSGPPGEPETLRPARTR